MAAIPVRDFPRNIQNLGVPLVTSKGHALFCHRAKAAANPFKGALKNVTQISALFSNC